MVGIALAEGGEQPCVVLGSPRVTVAVKAARDATRLWWNVDPNLGSASWRVTIQRQRDDWIWARMGVYRTLGTAEARSVDLPCGTYRVVVDTLKGFQRAASAEVSRAAYRRTESSCPTGRSR